jgi:predicted alpha/beta superfamily hydrolase
MSAVASLSSKRVNPPLDRRSAPCDDDRWTTVDLIPHEVLAPDCDGLTMLRQLNLLPLLIIPIATGAFAVTHDIVNVAWLEFNEREVPPPIAEEFQMVSTQTGKPYVIHVRLPGDYNETSKTYPVLYVAGSQPFPDNYPAVLDPLLKRSRIPDLITVSVTPVRKQQSLQAAFMQSRGTGDPTRWSDDLTLSVQTSVNVPETGGKAEAFVSFFEHELFPKIEAQYRVAPADRGLAGHGIAGIFVIETALTRPELFTKYLALAPTAQWGNYNPVRLAGEKMRMDFDPNIRLFVATGADDITAYVTGFDRLQTALNKHPREKFQVRMELVGGRNYETIIVPGAQQGMQYLYGN